MSRKRIKILSVVTLALILVIVVFGGQMSGQIETWLRSLHGQN